MIRPGAIDQARRHSRPSVHRADDDGGRRARRERRGPARFMRAPVTKRASSSGRVQCPDGGEIVHLVTAETPAATSTAWSSSRAGGRSSRPARPFVAEMFVVRPGISRMETSHCRAATGVEDRRRRRRGTRDNKAARRGEGSPSELWWTIARCRRDELGSGLATPRQCCVRQPLCEENSSE